MRIKMTYQLAHAVATDAGNASAKRGGRKVWNADDYNAMVDAFHKLYPCPDGVVCPVCTTTTTNIGPERAILTGER